MNDEAPMTEEQLQLATSRQLPPDAALHGDLAAARATFLSLGQSLEQAAAPFNEQAILDGVRKRLAAHSALVPASSPPVATQKQRHSPLGWIAIALSVAAATLIALSLLPSSEQSAPVVQQPVVNMTPPIATESLDEGEPPPTPLAWNDQLDDEIALAAATLDQWTTSTRGVDASLTSINNELSSLSEELLSDSL